MGIVKVNKSGLDNAAGVLESKISIFESEVSTAANILSSIPTHKDFPDLTNKAGIIADSLRAISEDYSYLTDNISMYSSILSEIDDEGFNTSSEYLSSLLNPVTPIGQTETPKAINLVNNTKKSSGNYTYSYSTGPNGTVVSSGLDDDLGDGTLIYTNNVTPDKTGDVNPIINLENNLTSGEEIEIPDGLGSVFTYMAWQLITSRSSLQYKLKEAAGMNFDDEGFGKIGDRYVVACTTTYGNVGDLIDVYQEDGTVLKCIIGDIKSQEDAGCNKWGHSNGQNIIEFVVDKSSWYNCGHPNAGTSSFHPEWNQNITKIVNVGNYFDIMESSSEEDLIVV